MEHPRDLEAEKHEDTIAMWQESARQSRKKYFVRGIIAAAGLTLVAVGLGELISNDSSSGAIELVAGAAIGAAATNEARKQLHDCVHARDELAIYTFQIASPRKDLF